MDFFIKDNIDRNSRTLWVGNLHPKVSNAIVAELFYQVGPIEFIEFAYDEQELRDNFACIVFKYPSSVEDSIKLLQGTKLYGLEIVIKKYSEELREPVFDDQLNYFKQLVNVEQRNQTHDGNKRWNDQNKDNQNIIPDSLPEPPIHGNYNLKNNDYDHRSEISEIMSRNRYKDHSSKYQHSNSYIKHRNPDCGSEYQSIDKSHQSRGYYQKSEHNSRSSSIMSSHDRSSYTQTYDRKHQQDYGSMWKESNYYNQEQLHSSESFTIKDELPVRDLRDTIHRRRHVLDSEYQSYKNPNAACTSTFDLRDTMYHGKNNRCKDVEPSYQLESKSRWSERKKNVHSGGFSGKPFRKDNNSSERYGESNTMRANHYSDQDYNVQSFSYEKSYNSFQDRDKEYSNNYDGYNREKNRPNNFKYSQPRRENIEFKSRQHNLYHPYKHSDDVNDKKEYKSIHNEQSRHSRGRCYKDGFDKMHNY